MKKTVEEGLQVLSGNRLRVSLNDCSLARLESMLVQLDNETKRLSTELAKAEAEVLELYQSADNVVLNYSAGQYQFPLDNYRDRLVDLRTRLEELTEKRKPIYKAYQEKYLLERQAKVLGGARVVKTKDKIVFGLIIVVLVLLAIDAGNIGATGEGAKLKPLVRYGSVVGVEIVEGGNGYKAARANAIGTKDNSGRGFEVVLEVSNGAVSNATILGDGGSGYSDNLELSVSSVLSAEQQHTFWWIDFVCCMVFLANFFFELLLSASKRWYWRTHWIDFITSIPLPPAQVLASIGLSGSEAIRAGRLIRILRLLRALRAMRLFLFMWRGLDHFAELFDVRLMKKSFGVGFLVLLVGAVLITLFGEQGEGHEAVSGFLPGLWWSFTTLVTGGFGDIYNPQTLLGRLLTVFLVISGMVLVGVFTATLTTILVGKEERAQAAIQNELLDQIRAEGKRVESALKRVENRQLEIEKRINQSGSAKDE